MIILLDLRYDLNDDIYDYPDGFNVLSEEDWTELVRNTIEYWAPIEDAIYGDEEDRAWRPIRGARYYEVSSYGKVRSLFDSVPRYLSPWPNQYGHLYVQLAADNGEHKKHLVHRLVAEAFIPNPHNYPIVRHLNDNPVDNRVENLAWGTQADNVHDMLANQREHVVGVYCYELGMQFRSVKEASEYFGVKMSTIVSACKGNSHTVIGKHLCYLKDVDEKMNNKEEWLAERSLKKPVYAISPEDGAELYFPSVREAAKYLGIPGCGISSVLSGRVEHTHGWRFRRAG